MCVRVCVCVCVCVCVRARAQLGESEVISIHIYVHHGKSGSMIFYYFDRESHIIKYHANIERCFIESKSIVKS